MKFFRRFLRAWREARDLSYVEIADSRGYWTQQDALATATFFQRTESGKKLREILCNFVLRTAVEATRKEVNLPYHCGHAAGIAATATLLQNHFSRVPAQRDESKEATTDPRQVAFLESIGADI